MAGVAAFAVLCSPSVYYASPAESGLEPALALIRSGRLREAEVALNENLSASTPAARALFWKGYVQFADKRYKESVETLRTYIERNAADAQAHKVQGLSLFMLGDAPGAQVQLDAALRMDPVDGEARYYLGRVYFTRQNMPAALATFQKLVELDPKSVRGYNQLGQTYEALNRYEDAEKAYLASIALDRQQSKKSEWPYYNLGLLQLNVGRAAEAIERFNEALGIQPKFAEARLKHAVALASVGGTDRARAELEALVSEEPTNADAHYQLGRLLTRLGETAKGREHLLQFQKLRHP